MFSTKFILKWFKRIKETSTKLLLKVKACFELVIETINKTLEYLAELTTRALILARRIKIRTIAAGLSAVFCFTVTAAAYASEFTQAVRVTFNGTTVGYVKDMALANSLKQSILQDVHGKFDCEGLLAFTQTSVQSENISSLEHIKAKVLETDSSFVQVCGLYVDGVLTAVAPNWQDMQDKLKMAVDHFTSPTQTFCGYENNIVLRDIYTTTTCFNKMSVTQDGFISGKYGVLLKVSGVEEYEETIAFDTTTQKNASYYTSYKKVKQKGVNGTAKVTANVTYINGEKIAVDVIEKETVKAAVDEIVVVGTKKKTVSHNGYDLATSVYYKDKASMHFPVELGGSTYITSYWGDGRGHKGLDIAAPKGTKVYAAANGVVSYVGYKSDYGYLVIIDHNDGKTKTYYAHNSKNLVKKGQKVTAGQHIANVGASGNATGNHLHFEVRINGTLVDAAPYVGIYK